MDPRLSSAPSQTSTGPRRIYPSPHAGKEYGRLFGGVAGETNVLLVRDELDRLGKKLRNEYKNESMTKGIITGLDEAKKEAEYMLESENQLIVSAFIGFTQTLDQMIIKYHREYMDIKRKIEDIRSEEIRVREKETKETS